MILLFLSSLILGTPTPSELSVTLPKTASVTGLEIRLGDIVEVDGTDPEQIVAAREVRFGQAPLPGFHRFVRVQEVRRALKRAGLDPSRVRFAGAEEVAVQVATESVSGAELITGGKEFLEEELAIFAAGSVEREIELEQELPDLVLPRAREHRELEYRWPGLPRTRGAVTIQLVVTIDGTRFRTIPLRYSVRVFQDVIITTRPLERGDRLASSDFRRERQEITSLDAAPVSGLAAPSDLELLHRTSPGTVLTATNTRRATLVEARAIVTVHYRSETIQLRTLGKALDAGARGDVVRIQNLDSERVVTARVVGPSAVEIVHR